MMAKRILVIDDEDGIRELIQMVLASAGWEVLMAASGSEGILAAAAEQPDAILLDLMMPEMDGRATLQQLQVNETTQSIPIIMLTAAETPNPQQRLSNLDVAGVITKPFEVLQFAEQIQAMLNWSE